MADVSCVDTNPSVVSNRDVTSKIGKHHYDKFAGALASRFQFTDPQQGREETIGEDELFRCGGRREGRRKGGREGGREGRRKGREGVGRERGSNPQLPTS